MEKWIAFGVVVWASGWWMDLNNVKSKGDKEGKEVKSAPKVSGTAPLRKQKSMRTTVIGEVEEMPQIPVMIGAQGKQPSFGMASTNNVFSINRERGDWAAATKDTKIKKAPHYRYVMCKYITVALDYAMLASWGYAAVQISDEKFTIRNCNLVNAFFIQLLVIFMDLIKMFLFSDLVSQYKIDFVWQLLVVDFLELFSRKGIKKIGNFLYRLLTGEGFWKPFSTPKEELKHLLYHLFWYIRIEGVFTPLVFTGGIYFGLVSNENMLNTAFTFNVGSYVVEVPLLFWIYLEAVFVSFLKDAFCMQVLHKMMHKHWYHLHRVHHLPMRECIVFSSTTLDLVDWFIEDLCAGTMLLLVKYLLCPCTDSVKLHYFTFVLAAVTDINSHSCIPYTVCFFNPILDGLMHVNISHNLHHAFNKGHYGFWPLHQLKGVSTYSTTAKRDVDGSPALDLRDYNRIMKTAFPLA